MVLPKTRLLSRSFSHCKLVLVPNLIVTDPDFAARLKAYVARGGVAVVTYRTAVKDRDNNLAFGKTIPVDCGALLGLYVEETESVQAYDCIPLAAVAYTHLDVYKRQSGMCGL